MAGESIGDITGVVYTGEVGSSLPPHKNGGDKLTRGDWIRIVVWSVPLIFMAATMYVSVNFLSEKTAVQEEHLEKLDEASHDLKVNQKVIQQQVGEISQRTERLIIKADKMDDKLITQGEDLSAIRAKLNVRRSDND